MKKFNYAKNASSLHRKVGKILSAQPPWTSFHIDQEVAVSSVFPKWEYSTERYDWVIYDLEVIIECHGIQHYKCQSFGQDAAEALMNFEFQKSRDSRKEEIAGMYGWTYLIIPYKDEKKLDANYLQTIYSTQKVSGKAVYKQPEETKIVSEYEQQQLEKAKAYRRKQYVEQKKLKTEFAKRKK